MGRGPTPEYYKVLHEDYVEGSLTCLKPEVIKRVVNKQFPNVLNIEPTNRCNYRCTYCPRELADKGVGNMDWNLYTRIIDEAADYPKLIMLHLFKDGESQIHPRFYDMVDYAKKKDVAKTVRMNTNASLWNDRVIDQLLDCGIDDMTVSIDAARPETYAKTKGVSIDYLERVERQVRRFFEKRAQRNLTRPFVRVKIMEFDEISKEELREFFDKWDGVADLVQVTGVHSWSGAIQDLRITDEQTPKRFPCALMWYALVVNWNGEVTVCSVDWNTEICVGDVNKQTLHEVWNSSKLKGARKAHVNGHYCAYKVCKDCVVWVSVGDMGGWFKERTDLYT